MGLGTAVVSRVNVSVMVCPLPVEDEPGPLEDGTTTLEDGAALEALTALEEDIAALEEIPEVAGAEDDSVGLEVEPTALLLLTADELPTVEEDAGPREDEETAADEDCGSEDARDDAMDEEDAPEPDEELPAPPSFSP